MAEAPLLKPIHCPQCQTLITPTDAACPACGADVALYALMAEQEWRWRASARGPAQVESLEQLVPRLGEYLLRNNYVNEAQLHTALERQAEAGVGRARLGQTLVDMGILSREALDKVVAEQIMELQAALLHANRSLEARVSARTAELKTALDKVSEFNQLKANFVANVSHELRTPLAKIKGYTSLMAEGALGPLTREQEDALRVTSRASEQLEQLVNDLIAYAQSARGELSLNLQPIPVAAVVNPVIQKSTAKAEKKGVGLQVLVAEETPLMLADESKLHWVLLQLVDNAIKFTQSAGQVTLRAAPSEGRVLFVVQDTGIGISAARLGEIFEPFQQLDGSATRRYGGTGLGLTLVRRIVEAHGSEVHVESQEGQGSTFSFSLAPAVRPASP